MKGRCGGGSKGQSEVGPGTKEFGQPLEARKDQGADPPWSHQKQHRPAGTSLVALILDSAFQHWEIINLCCFEPCSLL